MWLRAKARMGLIAPALRAAIKIDMANRHDFQPFLI
jgi:hypothetical protein